MQIQGVYHIHGAQPVQAPHQLRPAQPTSGNSHSAPVDQLDISPEADLVSRARDASDIRADRVAQLRAQIEAGTYETEEKLDFAVGRLLDEIGG